MSENQPAQPAPPNVNVGNMQDVKGIVALVTVIGYLGISAAAIFTKTVTDPTPLLNGLGILATAVVMFFFGTKTAQANQ